MTGGATSRRSSTSGSSAASCYVCKRAVQQLDLVISCSRCRGKAHQKCANFDDTLFKCFTKISHLVCFNCPTCQDAMNALEGRLACVESELANLKAQQPNVGAIVKEVCQSLVPQLMSSFSEMMEQNNKKNNLVIVGLSENVDVKEFVVSTCDKFNIDHGDVSDCFRDGVPRPGGPPRIVKVKFRTSVPRRNFLTGFRGVHGGQTGVWVRPDLTFNQRQRDRELRGQLKQRREDAENVKIFRGQIVPK